jgi:hypothetical protein
MEGWRMAGHGSFRWHDHALESVGGPGLLWYEREPFDNFVLSVEWRVWRQTGNSGVYLRIPPLRQDDPDTDWLPAVAQGYEVQIDDRGFNPDSKGSDPLHQTGALYGLAPSTRIASNPVGEWNRFEIEARGRAISVWLNGDRVTTYVDNGWRRLGGYIGLQNHDPTSRVAFRNMTIRRLV